MKEVEIYTRACKGNPGAGVWGALLESGGKTRGVGGEAYTHNRMSSPGHPRAGSAAAAEPVRLHTDSQYVQLGISE